MVESNCTFRKKRDSIFIKIDGSQEYENVSQFLKIVEGILMTDKVYFIEVKRYDYFRKELIDENLNKIINKVIDSYFFISFLKTPNEIIKKVSRILRKTAQVILVIYICPPHDKNLYNTYKKDGRIIIKEIVENRLKRKLKILNIIPLIDTEENKLQLFENITEK
jgi:hypothetical protein